jgi:flagella basal body P-ring formation protein FlgA
MCKSRVTLLIAAVFGVLCCGPARAQAEGGAAMLLQEQVRQMAVGAAAAKTPRPARVEVEIGALNPRLRLAACNNIQPYLPAGLPMWGRTRVGLRCVDGPVRWNVSLPLLVKVYTKAVVAAEALPAGAVLTEKMLTQAEIDIAADPSPVFAESELPLGRTLARPLAAGEAVRANVLQKRQWFAVGANVMVETAGNGFSISSEGEALSPGIEGQDVRIRLENGRTITGRAVGERRVEVLL